MVKLDKIPALLEFANLRSNAMFLAIHGYKNNFQELSDFSVLFHVDYKAAIRKSVQIISAYRPKPSDWKDRVYTRQDLLLAKEELLDSYRHSLTDYNPYYTCHGVYALISGPDGKVIPGIKLHIKDNVLHLHGYRVHKRIHVAGIYPDRNSLAITIAKNFLRGLTPVSAWRQWRLSPGKFQTITVGKLSINGTDVVEWSSDSLI